MIVTAIAARPVPPMPMPSDVGNEPRDDGGRRHENRPQPRAARFGDGVAERQATGAQDVGVVHLQDRVLLDDAEQQQHAERAPQVQRAPGRPQREERERHGNRQRQHDDDGLEEALELRGEHHVHEDHREADRHDQIGGRLVENPRLSLQPVRHRARQLQPGEHPAHVVGGFVERVALRRHRR